MSDNPIRGRPAARRALLWFAAVGLLALTVNYSLNRGKPERVRELGPSLGAVTQIAGNLYWSTQLVEGIQIHSMSISGGKERIIATDKCPGMQIGPVQITEAGLFYTLKPKPKNANSSGGGIGMGASGPPQYLGTFLASRVRKVGTNEKRTETVFRLPTDQPLGELRRIGLDGESAEKMIVDTKGVPLDSISAYFVPGGMYWSKSNRRRSMRVDTHNGYWYEIEPVGEILFSPFGGGAAKTVATGIQAEEMGKGREYLFWTSLRPYPDLRHDLHCMRLSSRVETVIHDYDGPVPPLEFGERFLWLDQPLGKVGESSRTVGYLMSIRPDGTDQRTEVQFRMDEAKRQFARSLFEHRNELYMVLAESHQAQKLERMPDGGLYMGEGSKPEYTLVKLEPGSQMPPVVVCRLPRTFSYALPFAVNGFFYFSQVETHESLFDWMSASTTSRSTSYLYRIPLQ